MIRTVYACPKLIIALLCIAFITSCTNNSGDASSPSKTLGNKQPSVQLLVFTAPKKITWDTTKTGSVTPITKPFDINALPSQSYDSVDFRPFTKPPAETRFNYSSLPSKSFDIDSIPDEPLGLRTRLIHPQPPVPVGKFINKPGVPISVASFGVPQGLPGSIVTCLVKDHSGLLWIATDEGVYRYDGEFLQTFITGLQRNLVFGMAEDNDGNIWGIQTGGIGVINPKNGTGSNTRIIKAHGNDFSYLVKDDKGRLWVNNTKEGGVYIINPATQTFKHLTEKNGFPGTGYNMVQDRNKNIWISTKGSGLHIIDSSNHKITFLNKSAGISSDSTQTIALDSTGNIWAEVNDSIANAGSVLTQIDVTNGLVKKYGGAQGIRQSYGFTLLADGKGRIWLAQPSPGGLQIVDAKKGQVKQVDNRSGFTPLDVVSALFDGTKTWVSTATGLYELSMEADVVHPIDNSSISALSQDAAGNIWVGTSFLGVRIVDPQKKTVRYFDKRNGLANNLIQAFYEIDGNIWVTSNGGIDIIDEQHKTLQHIGKAEGLANDTVYSLIKDNTGNIWLTAPSAGIDVIDIQNKLVKHLDTKGGLNEGGIADVKQDKDGLVWLATIAAGGVDIVNTKDGTVKYLNNAPGLSDVCNRILLLDESGRMWIGTDKGVYIADTKNNTLTTITTTEGLAGNKIISLVEHEGKIYAASTNRVSIITPPAQDDKRTGWNVETLENSDILEKTVTNSWATDIITKDGKYIWGDSGLTVINNLKGYTDSTPVYVTGLQVMNENGHFLNKPGLSQKDTLFDVDTIYIRGQLPAGNSYRHPELTWDSVQGPYNMPVNLQMPYNKNYMRFQFIQAHTGAKDATLYSYFLQGIDKEWSKPTNVPFTENYLNLPPGAYIFKVAAKRLDGKWSEPATFSFTILPPWYKTWWAYTLYIIIIVAAISIFVKYRSRKLINENILLEEKIKQRTEALQRSIEDLRTTQSQLVQSEKMASLGELTAGIAHEIQNPLNFVNNFSEVSIELVDELKEELNKTALDAAVKASIDMLLNDLVQNQQKINFHGKRADSIVKGMLQHSRTGSGQKELADINTLADEYLRLSYHGLRAKDKTFNARLETSFDENLPKVHILMQDVGRVLLNLYTNAFYSVMKKKKEDIAGYQPTVSVSTLKKGNQVEIRVKDNGLGIPQSVLDKIYNPFFTTKPTGEGTGLGLSLSYEIITKGHGGTINVETKEGEFAEFIIRIPVQ